MSAGSGADLTSSGVPDNEVPGEAAVTDAFFDDVQFEGDVLEEEEEVAFWEDLLEDNESDPATVPSTSIPSATAAMGSSSPEDAPGRRGSASYYISKQHEPLFAGKPTPPISSLRLLGSSKPPSAPLDKTLFAC